MKYDYLCLLAGIIAFSSLVLPWWTLSLSFSSRTDTVTLYPWGATGNLGQMLGEIPELWWIYVTMTSITVGGVLALVSSLTISKNRKTLLTASALISVLSLVVFITGLIWNLSRKFPGVIVFYFGKYYFGEVSAYLSIGFGLELTACVIAFLASRRRPSGQPANPL